MVDVKPNNRTEDPSVATTSGEEAWGSRSSWVSLKDKNGQAGDLAVELRTEHP